MRKYATLISLLVAARAYAAPCDMKIVRAPDDLRAAVDTGVAVERWLGPLKIRIFPAESTDNAYRVALDAPSAGVHVGCWAVDATQPDKTVLIEMTYAPPSPFGIVDSVAPPAQSAPRQRSRSVGMFGTMLLGGSDGLGLHGDVELARLRPGLRVGAAVGFAREQHHFYRELDSGEMTTIDLATTLMLAGVAQAGEWHVRGTVGAGLVTTYSDARVYDSSDPAQAQYERPQALGLYPFVEASGVLGHPLARHGDNGWSFETGPLVTVLRQRFSIKMPLPGGPDQLPARGVELSWIVGVRRAL